MQQILKQGMWNSEVVMCLHVPSQSGLLPIPLPFDSASVNVCVQGQGMRDAEMLVWAGDFNYRIEANYEEALEHIRNNDLDYLIDRVSPPAPFATPLLSPAPFASPCCPPASFATCYTLANPHVTPLLLPCPTCHLLPPAPSMLPPSTMSYKTQF